MPATGNLALRAARQAHGLRSQTALADALNKIAREMGFRASITARTVRRWESEEPPWPHTEHATVIEAYFKHPLSDLGFTPPWSGETTAPQQKASSRGWAPRRPAASIAHVPASIAGDYMNITASHRHMYWVLPAARLYRSVADHAALGRDLLDQMQGSQTLARAVAESSLLAGRLAFFDLQDSTEDSRPHFTLALEAAHQAEDNLLAAAALAHMAFEPAFAHDATDSTEDAARKAEDARDKLRAAGAFARRGDANAEMLAWLDAVEAEVETRFGDTRRALELINHAEEVYRGHDATENPSPVWLDWFSVARLAGFKGNTLLHAGRGAEARATLEQVLEDLPPEAVKQRAVVHADVAAAAVLERDPELACTHLTKAIEILGFAWYATGMDRVKGVRKSLREWDSLPVVRHLDDALYNWNTTMSAVAR